MMTIAVLILWCVAGFILAPTPMSKQSREAYGFPAQIQPREVRWNALKAVILIAIMALSAPFIVPDASAQTPAFETRGERAQRLREEGARSDATEVCDDDAACVDAQLAARGRMYQIFNATSTRDWVYAPGAGVIPTGGPDIARAGLARDVWITAAGQATDRRQRVDWVEAETTFQGVLASRGVSVDLSCIETAEVNQHLCFRELAQ